MQMLLKKSLFALTGAATLGACASLQAVTDFGENPTSINMNIYVPDQVAENPAIIVALHPCGGNAQQWFAGTKLPSYADTNGFIMIYPATPHMIQNPASLTHNGGGDALGIVSMVNYTLAKYAGDAARVYVMGSSSGGMMTNVMAGSYPDVFEAGAAYSGVAHACFAGAPSATPFSPNQTCAQGLAHTPEEWAAFVRNSYPGYEGRRTRMMIVHGTTDALVRPACAAEALKQWSAVLGEPFAANHTNTPASPYTQMLYGTTDPGAKLQGYFGAGLGHMPPVNEQLVLEFFGIL
ncbi:feruloyl esterase B [Xylariomycetidae sp. FL2044]|nr:feruloyl esterase B [Xylariomycetidae sp. FL2044]